MTDTQRISIARIVRVNHAGEYGAIRIYGAQILVASKLWPDVAVQLRELRSHEIRHCKLFADAMPSRGSRACRSMWLWSWGGWVLGFATAILGRNMIWVCTEVVETNVHQHLTAQLKFLSTRDRELYEIIESIREEEDGHIKLATENRASITGLYGLASKVISASVHTLVWLSTWGDSARMRRDFEAKF